MSSSAMDCDRLLIRLRLPVDTALRKLLPAVLNDLEEAVMVVPAESK